MNWNKSLLNKIGISALSALAGCGNPCDIYSVAVRQEGKIVGECVEYPVKDERFKYCDHNLDGIVDAVVVINKKGDGQEYLPSGNKETPQNKVLTEQETLTAQALFDYGKQEISKHQSCEYVNLEDKNELE